MASSSPHMFPLLGFEIARRSGLQSHVPAILFHDRCIFHQPFTVKTADEYNDIYPSSTI